MSKIQASAARALVELQAWRAAQNAPARQVVFLRWPERAQIAGVQAKLRRRLTWRGSRPGDVQLAAMLDRVMVILGKAGVWSW